MFTLSLKEKVVIALAVIGFAILLEQYSDVNFAQPLVELEQGQQ